jgi:hypothetical protein
MDPTITYLFNPKRSTTLRPIQEFDESYKQRIIDLTIAMFEKNTVHVDSFQMYVSDCIRFLKKQELEKDKEKEKDSEIEPINGDQFIFVPKKIDILIKKKQKNMFLIHGKP